MAFRFRLDSLAKLDGFIAACLFDRDSGMLLGVLPGDRSVALEGAAAGWTALLHAQRKAGEALANTGEVEELLVRLPDQLHLLRPLAAHQGLCFGLVLDRKVADGEAKLALARLELSEAEKAVL